MTDEAAVMKLCTFDASPVAGSKAVKAASPVMIALTGEDALTRLAALDNSVPAFVISERIDEMPLLMPGMLSISVATPAAALAIAPPSVMTCCSVDEPDAGGVVVGVAGVVAQLATTKPIGSHMASLRRPRRDWFICSVLAGG